MRQVIIYKAICVYLYCPQDGKLQKFSIRLVSWSLLPTDSLLALPTSYICTIPLLRCISLGVWEASNYRRITMENLLTLLCTDCTCTVV